MIGTIGFGLFLCYLGFAAAEEKRRRARLWSDYEHFLFRASQELDGSVTTRKLLRKLSEDPTLSSFFILTECIKQMETHSFSESWQLASALDPCRKTREEEGIFNYPAVIIGQKSSDEQRIQLRALHQTVQTIAKEVRDVSKEQIMRYRVLGTLSACFWWIIKW